MESIKIRRKGEKIYEDENYEENAFHCNEFNTFYGR